MLPAQIRKSSRSTLIAHLTWKRPVPATSMPSQPSCSTQLRRDARRGRRKGESVQTYDRPGLGWTVVLRRQPARIIEGRPEGGYTNAYELICCDCGDDPGV